MSKIGIIGGSGLYQLENIEITGQQEVHTPFGSPSSPITLGKMGGHNVAFLPRHGQGHNALPSEINYRANVWALKSLGVENILSVSAVGSLRLEIKPGELAIPSQYFDWTKGLRTSSFFSKGLVGHISSAHPASPELTQWVKQAASKMDLKIHTQKTYACVEGPRLGTQAESHFLRTAGCDLVGMTNVPEAFLALEAQINYITLAVVTDYDCWLDDPSQHASVDQVFAQYKKTLATVVELLQETLQSPLPEGKYSARKSLQGALISSPEQLNAENKKIWEVLQR